MTSDPTWRARAACRGLGPDLFFVELGDSAAAGKAVCANCPVVEPCLNEALDNWERHGTWGGATEKERRKIRRQRAAARRASRLAATAVAAADVSTEDARRATVHRLYRSGMTAAAVAAATGISESTVWRLLRRAA